ncbi:sensor histidine kinase [Candidatus Latescibacterota bacterium]
MINSQSQKSLCIPFEMGVSAYEIFDGGIEDRTFRIMTQKNGAGAQAGKIIVIDDEESMQDSCIQVLSREGYGIFTAFDAEQGLSLVRETRPDIVLLDLKLPGKSGGEIIRAISSIDPSIIVVVITGYATVESAVEAMKQGASDFLPKPFTPDELRIIVERAMEKRSLMVGTVRLQNENTRIRENFVSIITHEMRSPLVVVEQYMEVLLGGYTGDIESKQYEILTQCKQRINWLLSLVNEWLEMARIQETIILEKVEVVDIRKIIDEAVDIIRIIADDKGIHLEYDIPDDFPSIVGNHEALVHLFLNLYSNAVKYNCVSGTITTSARDEDDSISIEIADTGIGIPKEMLPFVFDEFFRVSNIRKKSSKSVDDTGTGLGLAIVKKFVDAHKGYINVESCENGGTRFTVHLPKKQPLKNKQEISTQKVTE